MSGEKKIGLAEMLAELRRELLAAQEAADDRLALRVDGIELEVALEAAREAGGGGGVKFWVYNADAKVKASESKTHRLKLTLSPTDRATGRGFSVSDDD